MWTKRQRVVLMGMAGVLAIGLLVRYWWNPAYLSDPLPERGSRAGELADRIDPNTADEAALAALPTLGPKRAAEIVEYRELYLREARGPVAFRTLDDLLKIKGIGAATIETLRPHLRFPDSASSKPAAGMP